MPRLLPALSYSVPVKPCTVAEGLLEKLTMMSGLRPALFSRRTRLIGRVPGML